MDQKIIESGLEVSRGISELGFLIVAAGFFVVFSVIVVSVTMVRYNKAQKLQDTRFQQLLTKVTSNDNNKAIIEQTAALRRSIEDLITPINSLLIATTETMKEEITYNQFMRILKIELIAVKFTLLDSIKSVIKRNHIDEDPEGCKYKIRRIVNNTYTSYMGGLSLYKYKSIRLPDYQGESWCDQVSELLIKFALGSVKDYEKLESDIDLVITEAKSEFESNINEASL